jgi:hypothetical protein
MIPIVDSPEAVRQFTNHFSTTISYQQTKRTEQYLTGIITGRRVSEEHKPLGSSNRQTKAA